MYFLLAISSTDALHFQRLVAPHLDAGYNLARWLTRNPDHARDAVQDAALRACRILNSYNQPVDEIAFG